MTPLILAALLGCGGHHSAGDGASPKMRRTLIAFRAADPSVRNVVVRIGHGKTVKTAGDGLAAPGVKMTPDTPFRSASVGKMAMAATVLRLSEEGKIDLDAPLSAYLDAGLLEGLAVVDGTDYGPKITIRQLLGHTSGLPDYFEDGTPNALGLSPFKHLLLANPTKVWSPEEPILWAKANLKPLFKPGAGYHYSETGFQLLGLVVQKASGLTLQTAYRQYVFDPLGMVNTSLEWREPLRAKGKLAHAYQGDLDLTEVPALSAEWGGGGLVTTAGDLAKLVEGVGTGRIFRRPETFAAMCAWHATDTPGVQYGLGISKIATPIGDFLGHDGYYNSFAFYCPQNGASYVGTLDQAEPAKSSWIGLVNAVAAED